MRGFVIWRPCRDGGCGTKNSISDSSDFRVGENLNFNDSDGDGDGGVETNAALVSPRRSGEQGYEFGSNDC